MRCSVKIAAAVAALALPFPGDGAVTAYVDGAFTCSRFMLTRDMSSLLAYDTRVVFTASDAGLEIRLSAEAENAAALEGDGTSVWNCADSMEFFFDDSGSGKKLLHLAVSADGALYDGRTPKADRQALEWKAEVKRSGRRWTAVAVLPWKTFGLKAKPAAGTKWRFNIGRNFRDAGGTALNSSFAPTGIYYKTPAKFADLYFGSPDEVGKALVLARRRRLVQLRGEIASLGAERCFATRLSAYERTGKDALVAEIRDELAVMKAISKMDGK